MASANGKAEAALDASLWWDPFPSLLAQLESNQLPPSPDLVSKLKENCAWFLHTVSFFRSPGKNSRDALLSDKVKIGPRVLFVKPELRDKALDISSFLGLDEVQSYILVERSSDQRHSAVRSVVQSFRHLILLQYHLERQCLLKCTRRILTHALADDTNATESVSIREEALKMISGGLENKMLTVLDKLLTSIHPEQMDVDLYTLWAEETLTEDNLVLDILFIIYYESLCTCNGDKWRRLCLIYKEILSGSYNLDKLAVSVEAERSFYHAKAQLLFILMETLNLETVLQMVHDKVPMRAAILLISCASRALCRPEILLVRTHSLRKCFPACMLVALAMVVLYQQSTAALRILGLCLEMDEFVFSANDIQEIDALVSSLDSSCIREAGPLLFTWAVFLCLIESLLGKDADDFMREIDHLAYVRQAFEGASLEYFLKVLLSDVLKEYDGPIVGYRSVLRTVISSFIASYEINCQLEDRTFGLILDILCCIYRGEEALCIQFWDKESFIDGPIRCLLCNIEGDFPFRITGLVRLLSSLSEGHWPAECAYNFVDFLGISSLFKIDDRSLVDEDSQTVETVSPLPVPGMEGLVIPGNTRGHIVRIISGNTALVRWEHTVSGVSLLLLRLTQELYTDCNEEIFFILEFFNRMLSFNKGLCFNLMNITNLLHRKSATTDMYMKKNMWVVEVISSLVRNLDPTSKNAATVSMGVNVLVKMIECSPSDVAAIALRSDLFLHLSRCSSVLDSENSLRSWLLSGKLATMLLIENEQHECECSLTISVLDITMQLIESGWESDAVLQLIVFSLQYILVNHEYWKYKMKHLRWEVTLKVLEVMRKCILSLPFFTQIGDVIWDMLLCDSSIHGALFRIACTTTQTLELINVSRPFGAMEIGGLQLAIRAVLDILFIMLTKSLKDMPSRVIVFHQAILSPSTKPISVVSAAMSLISCFRNPPIQAAAARLLSVILRMVDYFKPMVPGMSSFSSDGQQIRELSLSVKRIMLEKLFGDEKLFLAAANLLTSAARFQPAFFLSVILVIDEGNGQQSAKNQTETTNEVIPREEPSRSSVLDVLLKCVKRCRELISSNVRTTLAILCILKALWEGASQYKPLLDNLKRSESFWKHLSGSLGIVAGKKPLDTDDSIDSQSESSVLLYQCQSAILEIMSSDVLMDKKLAHAESLVGRSIEVNSNIEHPGKLKATDGRNSSEVLSTWHDSTVLHSQIKMYASHGYNAEICFRAKVATSLFTVHVMGRLLGNDAGCLSNFLVERIRSFYKQLSSQPAFSELSVQYMKHRYSEGKEVQVLILNDLYYHLEGEFRGRKISPGPFKELFLYLADSNILTIYWRRNDDVGLGELTDELYLYDIARLRNDMRLDLWDFTSWKDSKVIAERMLQCMEAVNSMTLLCSSKLFALKALVTLLIVNGDDTPESDGMLRSSSRDDVLTSINNLCEDIRLALQQLALSLDTSKNVLEFLSSQAELLLFLFRQMSKAPSFPVCVAALRTSAHALRVLGNLNLSDSRVKTMLVFSLTLLLSLEYCNSGMSGVTKSEFSEDLSEVSNLSLGLLPILCHCLMIPQLCAVSLASMDLILRKFLTPSTWIPIIKEHLHPQYVIQRLQDKNSSVSSLVILKFLLTLAQVRVGAEILLGGGFFYSLRILFDIMVRGTSSSVINSGRDAVSEKSEKPRELWGLGLAVVTAIMHSLADCSPCIGIMNREMPYFCGSGNLFSYHLDNCGFLLDDLDKKIHRPQKTWTSLSSLEETERTLTLMYTLARLHGSWVKSMEEVGSQLREKCIHILAFISRGINRSSESATFLCPPESKEEVDCSKKPSIINSKSGWFSITPICCVLKSDVSAASTALAVKDHLGEIRTTSASIFSEIVALQIYRIAFLLMKFLCLQAENAAKRAEEVGFVDLAHFPELPMPEILHGLQDQAMSIVMECCGVNKNRQMAFEIHRACELMLQILEMALCLELCVLHICGIRPVLGRVEEFSKQLKLFLAATDGNVHLRASLGSFRQSVSLVYPGLL